MSSKAWLDWKVALAAAGSLLGFACAPEVKPLPPHPDLTVGGDTFYILCKRVAAAADTVDPSGYQYSPACNGTGPIPPGSRAGADPRFVAMWQRRQEIVDALDQVFGDKTAMVKDTVGFDQGELNGFLKNLVPFYDPPDRVIPTSTEAIADMMFKLMSEESIPQQVRATLERVAPRVGYRPIQQILGAVRPALTYPGLDDLSRQFLPLLAKGGKANGIFVNELKAGALALAEKSDGVPNDQRTLRKALALLFANDDAMAPQGAAPLWVVQRDAQGVAVLTDTGNAIPADKRPPPFARTLGLNGDGTQCPHGYDQWGRATDTACNLIYQYFDANRAVLAGVMRETYPLVTRDTPDEPSAVEKLSRGLRTVLGPTVMRTKKFDDGGQLTFNGPDVQQGAIFDLAWAGSQLLKYDETVRLLKLLNELMKNHENEAAGPVWAGLQINDLSNQPEYSGAHLVGVDGEGSPSEFWDDLIDVGVHMLDRPGQLEAVLRSFAGADSVAATHLIAKFMRYKDHVSYNTAPIKLVDDPATTEEDLWYDQRPSDDFLTGATRVAMNSEVKHQLAEEVDRTMPDIGMNRSLWQRLLSTIYATNGVPNCNKEGALLYTSSPLHPKNLIGALAPGVPLVFPDPNSQPNHNGVVTAVIQAACPATVTGSYKKCEFVKLANGAEAHMRSIIGKTNVTVKEKQLQCLVDQGLANDLGDTQQLWSQIDGFKLSLTPQSIARFIHAPRNHFVTGLFDPFATKHGVSVVDFEPDILFALEMTQDDIQFGGKPQSFLTAAVGLTTAFDSKEYFETTEDGPVATHGYMFAELLSTLHQHWPSHRIDMATGMPRDCAATVQPGDEGCSQSLDPKKPFYAPQSNLVSYEPLLIKALQDVKLGDILQKSSAELEKIQFDGKDGVTILADFLKLVLTVDPNLTYRDGTKYSATNTCLAMKMTDPMDPSKTNAVCGNNRGRVIEGVMPIYLVLDALKGIDKAFSADDDAKERHTDWLAARSKLVDQLLTVDMDNPADPSTAKFALHNRRAYAIALQLIPWLLDRINDHKSDLDNWTTGLAGRLSDVLGHPAIAAGLDLLDVVWNEKAAGAEFAKVASYLMDEADHPDAFAGLIVAASDTLNIIDKDPDLTPLVQFASLALAPNAFEAVATNGEANPNVENSTAYTGLELIKRITGLFQGPQTSTTAKLLKNAVLPDPAGKSPLETFIDTAAEINRIMPSVPPDQPLVRTDYKNVFDQTYQFLHDPDRGLERLYSVIENRTLIPATATAQMQTTTTPGQNP